MKKNTKKIVTAAGIAAGTAAVASLSAYVTIKALIDTALDREMPKVMEKADKRISGEKSSDEFTNRMESASESLAVARINMYLLCQHSARHIQSLPRGFYICTKGFKARAVFNFCHSTSPTYILYFIVCTWNDLICIAPTFYNSLLCHALLD